MRRIYLSFFLLFGAFYPIGGLDSRLYFIHIPKTGGSSLRLLLESQVSPEEIYPFRNCKSARGPFTGSLVSGHFPYSFCKKLDENFEKNFTVTILRDPIERCLSFLRAKKKSNPQFTDLESALQFRSSPDTAYGLGLIDNALCKYLSEDFKLEGEALLESAKRVLEKLDYVIFFDRYTEDVIDFLKRLGIDLDEKDIPKINATEKEPVSEKLIEELKLINPLDIELYEYAKNTLSGKKKYYEAVQSEKYPYFLNAGSISGRKCFNQ